MISKRNSYIWLIWLKYEVIFVSRTLWPFYGGAMLNPEP